MTGKVKVVGFMRGTSQKGNQYFAVDWIAPYTGDNRTGYQAYHTFVNQDIASKISKVGDYNCTWVSVNNQTVIADITLIG